MALRRALLVVVVVTTLVVPRPSTASPSIEAQVFAKINAVRSSGLVLHSGLLSVARMHSIGMAQRGGLDHDDADSRIRNAAPDPWESNGAPDDGWPPARWCENVTYSVGVPEAEVPDRIYEAWARSGAHNRCMTDASRNVGAVGIHYDGERWWATFVANEDGTPPGGGASQGTPPAHRAQAAPSPALEPSTAVGPRTLAGSPAGRTETDAIALVGPVAPADPIVPPAVGADPAPRSGPTPGLAEPTPRRSAGGSGIEVRVASESTDPLQPRRARLVLLGYDAREIGLLFLILLLGSLYVCRRPRPATTTRAIFPTLGAPASALTADVERYANAVVPPARIGSASLRCGVASYHLREGHAALRT